MRKKTTIGQELAWFATWLVAFVCLTVIVLRFVVPHHFNDRVAVSLAGIASAVLVIALRAAAIGPATRR